MELFETVFQHEPKEEKEIVLTAVGLNPIDNFLHVRKSLTHSEENLVLASILNDTNSSAYRTSVLKMIPIVRTRLENVQEIRKQRLGVTGKTPDLQQGQLHGVSKAMIEEIFTFYIDNRKSYLMLIMLSNISQN